MEERQEMFCDKSKETFRVQSSEWMQFTMRRGRGGKVGVQASKEGENKQKRFVIYMHIAQMILIN